MLPKKKSGVELDPRRYRLFLYGEPGIGKTTFAANLFGGEVLFLDCEDGTKLHDVYTVQIKTWQDLEKTARELHAVEHGYKCIAVDTVDALRDLCVRAVCDELNAPNAGHYKFTNHGRGYVLTRQKFAEAIKTLIAGDWGVIFIGHEQSATIDQEGNPVPYGEKPQGPTLQRLQPSLPAKLRALLSGFCHIMTRAKLGQNGARFLQTADTKTEAAFDKTGALPPVLELDADTYTEHFRKKFQQSTRVEEDSP